MPQLALNANPDIPDIPMPEVFKNSNSYCYSGSSWVSPSVGSLGALTPQITDPDVKVITPPDRLHTFDVPRGVEYVVVPPTSPPTAEDPTGMQAMMEFLGFGNDMVKAGMSGFSQASSISAPPPSVPGSVGSETPIPPVQRM